MTDFSIWDQCQLNSELTKNIDKISESLSITNSKSNVIRGQNSEELKDAYVNSPGPASGRFSLNIQYVFLSFFSKPNLLIFIF